MAPTLSNSEVQRKICYMNRNPRELTTQKLHLERLVKSLGEVSCVDVSSIEDEAVKDSDLVVIGGIDVPEDQLGRWISRIGSRMEDLGNIWVPVIFVSDAKFLALRELLNQCAQSNWYFDIVNSAHFESLPVRIANLFRIHDHLKELFRYSEEINTLQERLEELERRLSSE